MFFCGIGMGGIEIFAIKIAWSLDLGFENQSQYLKNPCPVWDFLDFRPWFPRTTKLVTKKYMWESGIWRKNKRCGNWVWRDWDRIRGNKSGIVIDNVCVGFQTLVPKNQKTGNQKVHV